MIPARIGSKRFKMKNLAMLDGKPLIAYAIIAALSSKVFDRIILNSDSEYFREIAEKYGIEFITAYKKRKYEASLYPKVKNILSKLLSKNIQHSILSAGEQNLLYDLVMNLRKEEQVVY